jgi:chromosome segregation ATPase
LSGLKRKEIIFKHGRSPRRCIQAHRECSDIIPIDEVVDNAKKSQNFQDLRQEVEDLVENIKRLRTNREENLKTVNDQVQKHILKVQILRSSINQHLDKLEEELKLELIKQENKAKTDIQGTIAILKDKENGSKSGPVYFYFSPS